MSETYNEHEGEDIVLEKLPEEGEEGYDKIDWKAEALKSRGIAQRAKTKIEKLKSSSKDDEGKKKEDTGKKDEEGGEGKGEKGLDRIDKAILRGEKITHPKEIELVESIMKETGKDVEGVLESKYFQSELKALREEISADDATPKDGKRGSGSSKDSVEYWLAAGKLPPVDQPDLRRKVVNARIAKEKNKNQFSDNPIQ